MCLQQYNYKSNLIYSFLLLLFVLSGCGETYTNEDKEVFNTAIQDYISSQPLSYQQTESGIYYHIVSHAKDTLNEKRQLLPNDEVVFYYQGSFIDGEVFQDIEEKDALTFKVKELIYGWQEALKLIHPTGRIKVIIPPSLGYADNQTGLVPANSILLFDLTLKQVI